MPSHGTRRCCGSQSRFEFMHGEQRAVLIQATAFDLRALGLGEVLALWIL